MDQVYGSAPRPSPAKWRTRLFWMTEEQHVAVGVRDLETAQTVVRIHQRFAECCAMIGKFGGKGIGVRCIDKGVQPHVVMTLVVRERRNILVGFDEDLYSLAADNGEKRTLIRLSASRLETKLVAVEGDGLIHVAD